MKDRPSWDCPCTGKHRETIERAWCFDCSEWCHPNQVEMLCVRGFQAKLHAENEIITNVLKQVLELRDGNYKNNKELLVAIAVLCDRIDILLDTEAD